MIYVLFLDVMHKKWVGNLTPAIIVLSCILPFFNCSDLLVTAGVFVLKFAIFLEKGKLLIYMYGYGNHCDAVVAMATILIVFIVV